jgi:hypothetical protein
MLRRTSSPAILLRLWWRLCRQRLLRYAEDDASVTSAQDMAALYPHMEAQLKLLYTAITRSCRTLTFAETSESKAGAAFFRWLQDKDLAEPLTETDEINDWAAGAGEYNFEEWCRAQGLTLAATAVSEESLGKRVPLLENSVSCFRFITSTCGI